MRINLITVRCPPQRNRMNIAETLSGRIANSFLGYLHLGSWFDDRLKSLVSGRGPKTFTSVEAFWRAVLREQLHHGDRIQFKNAFLTEWIPRLPGAPWHLLGDQADSPNLRSRDYLRLGELRERKIGVVSETSLDYGPHPLGVVRLPVVDDPRTCACLCLTTVDAWCCDLGVPVIVSSSVYDAFVSRRQGVNAVEADLEGVLHFGTMPLLDQGFLKAMGVAVDSEFLRSVVTPTGHPYAFLRITSPLDTRMRTHGSAPPAFLWSISRKWITHAVTHYGVFSGSKEKPRIKVVPTDPYWSYGFLLAPSQPDDPESVQKCVRGFKLGNISAWIPEVGAPCAGPGVEVVEVLTEFDARAPHFSTAVPLVASPWQRPQQHRRIATVLQDMERRALAESRGETRTEQPPGAYPRRTADGFTGNDQE